MGNNTGSVDNNSFQSAFAGGFGGDGESSKGNDDNNNNNGMYGQQTSDAHPRNSKSSKKNNPTSAPAHRTTFGDLSTSSWNEVGRYDEKNQKKLSNDDKSPLSEGSSESSHSAPLLSLSLHRPGSENKQQQQMQPDFTTNVHEDASRSRMLGSVSTNTAINNLLGQMNNQMNDHADGSGMAGSAMLSNFAAQSPRGYLGAQNSFAPYAVPQRIHQNDALLNPNPIPFAFNLSNEPSQSASSWWEQMGGGRFTPGRETLELDEKAQAVAAAQANNGGAQSPFDLSAFLQGGITPGGGYSLGGSGSQDDGQSIRNRDAASGSGKVNDTDHMQMFVQLLERKVAEREAHTVASLGFQPPSQDPSQRKMRQQDQNSDKPKITFASALSPSGVYSRLAEHPAFLATDARELEELVDALGSGASRSPSEQQDGRSNQRGDSANLKSSSSPYATHQYMSGSGDKGIKRSHSQSSTSPGNGSEGCVEVDERAIDRLLGLLDQKRMVGGQDGTTMGQQQQHLSMAMT